MRKLQGLTDDHYRFVSSFVSIISNRDYLNSVCFLYWYLFITFVVKRYFNHQFSTFMARCLLTFALQCLFFLQAFYILFIRLAHCGAGGKVMHDCF